MRAEVADFIDKAISVPAGDYRFSLVDFGSIVQVRIPFSQSNAREIKAGIRSISQFDNTNNLEAPEAWDEALSTVINVRSQSEVGVGQIGDFQPWRDDANRIVEP